MPHENKNSGEGNDDFVTLNKKVDILQATFKHHYEMAMDHHTKAATTSQILLVVAGAVIGLASGGKGTYGLAPFVAGLAVFAIGCFGTVWAWKQHERYHYWEHIAHEYQRELIKLVPELKPESSYRNRAQMDTAREFGWLFAKVILDRYLWVGLHVFVAGIGLVLMAVSIINWVLEKVPMDLLWCR